MPRKPSGLPKKAAHRPQIPVDWSMVESRMISGCTAKEISGKIGMHVDTFYARFLIQYGASFTEVSATKKSAGISDIRNKQFECAMRGNTQLLLRLGDVLLEQDKKVELNPNDTNLDLLLQALQSNKSHQEEIQALKEKLNAIESKTDPVLPGSDEAL